MFLKLEYLELLKRRFLKIQISGLPAVLLLSVCPTWFWSAINTFISIGFVRSWRKSDRAADSSLDQLNCFLFLWTLVKSGRFSNNRVHGKSRRTFLDVSLRNNTPSTWEEKCKHVEVCRIPTSHVHALYDLSPLVWMELLNRRSHYCYMANGWAQPNQ